MPHGVYPCQRDDRYCAIAVHSDEEWSAFCRVLGDPPWCQEPRFATVLARSRNQDQLDENIRRWTGPLPAEEVMVRLQEAGVPASIVSRGRDLYTSPHLEARGLYRPTNYFQADRSKVAFQWQEGESIAWSTPVRLSDTPMEFGHYSNVGEDNSYVFEQLLGMPPGEVDRLASEGVIS